MQANQQPPDPAGAAPGLTAFRVTLGHNSVTINAASRLQAVEQARQQFCDDLPRLWDVIAGLDMASFTIQEASAVNAPPEHSG